MKSANREASPSQAPHRERRRPEHAAERRFVNAWGEADAKRQEEEMRVRLSPWGRLRKLSGTRAGRIVMLAPFGAVGAYLLLRRRKS